MASSGSKKMANITLGGRAQSNRGLRTQGSKVTGTGLHTAAQGLLAVLELRHMKKP